jgi:hypothetical protein
MPGDDEDQAQRQQAVDPEERRVSVHRRRVEALHVVERDRWIDEEPEEPGTHEIPERHADDPKR